MDCPTTLKIINMKQYFYIPEIYTPNILPAIDEWTEQPHSGWTIITGNYEMGSFRAGDNIIYNVDVRRVKTFIKNGVQYSINGVLVEGSLRAFCLEGDLDFYAPAFKAQLLQLQGVLAFDTAEEYLDYTDSLN